MRRHHVGATVPSPTVDVDAAADDDDDEHRSSSGKRNRHSKTSSLSENQRYAMPNPLIVRDHPPNNSMSSVVAAGENSSSHGDSEIRLERMPILQRNDEVSYNSPALQFFKNEQDAIVKRSGLKNSQIIIDHCTQNGSPSRRTKNASKGQPASQPTDNLLPEKDAAIKGVAVDRNSDQQTQQEQSVSFALTSRLRSQGLPLGRQHDDLFSREYDQVELVESTREQHILRMREETNSLRAFEHGTAAAFSRTYPLVPGATSYHPSLITGRMNQMLMNMASSQYPGIVSPSASLGVSKAYPLGRGFIGGGATLQFSHHFQYPLSLGDRRRLQEDRRAAIAELAYPASDRSLFTGIGNIRDVQLPLVHDATRLNDSQRGIETATDRKQSIAKGPPPGKKAAKRKPGARDRRFNSSTPISLVAAARSDRTENLELSGRRPISMYTDKDRDHLSDYQCYLRQQIEIFEANPEDLQYNAQKMNKAVVLGQVGIRCKHCAHEDPWARTRGAVYYSASLGGLYQAGQNMSKNHLEQQCNAMPTRVRDELLKKKEIKRRAAGGKTFWADSAKSLGIFEDQYGLRFTKEVPDAANQSVKTYGDELTDTSGDEEMKESSSNH